MWMAPKQEARRSRRAIACPASAEAVQVTNNPVRRSVWLRRGGNNERRNENAMNREVETQSGVQAAADNTNPSPDPGTPGTPVVVDYDTQAATLQAMVQNVPQIVPHWLPFHPTNSRAIRGGRAVSESFIAEVGSAVAATSELQSLNSFDVDEARDAQKYKTAYQPVAQLFTRIGRSLQFSIDSRMAKAGTQALQTYYLAKGLGRTPNFADALDVAKTLSDALGRKGRGPKSKKKEVPQPQPAPEPIPAPAELPKAA